MKYMPGFNRHGGGGGYKGGNGFGNKRPWDKGPMTRGFDDRPKFKTTCASCGNACEVPFKPNGSKPVFCRDCFKKEGDGAGMGGNSYQRQDARGFDVMDKQMHQATCATCGDACEVPFKPNGRKPIYCRACFKKDGDAPQSFERKSSYEPRPSYESRPAKDDSEQFRILNAKLDAILKALAPAAPAKAPEAKASETKAPAAKAEAKPEKAAKAPAKKKVAAKKKK